MNLCTPSCLPGGQGCPRSHPHELTERLQNEQVREARWWTELCRCRRVPSTGLGLRAEPTGRTHAMPQRHSCPGSGPCRGPSGVRPTQCWSLASSLTSWVACEGPGVPGTRGRALAALCTGDGGIGTLCTGVLLSKPKPPLHGLRGPEQAGSHVILRAVLSGPSSPHLLRIRGTA